MFKVDYGSFVEPTRKEYCRNFPSLVTLPAAEINCKCYHNSEARMKTTTLKYKVFHQLFRGTLLLHETVGGV